MMADGGKSEDGTLKEKRAWRPDVRPANVLRVVTRGDDSAEKNVRKMGRKSRQKRTGIRRGSRIFDNRRDCQSKDVLWERIRQATNKTEERCRVMPRTRVLMG
jgi:hypothetical protein